MASTSEQCTTCIDNLFVDIVGVEGKSKIAFCSCENKGQVAFDQEELQQLDAGELNQFEKAIQQFCTGNGLAFGELRKRSGEPSGSLGQVNRRQNDVKSLLHDIYLFFRKTFYNP